MGVGVFFPSGQLGISLTATFGSIIMTARPLGAIGLKGCLAVSSEREGDEKIPTCVFRCSHGAMV